MRVRLILTGIAVLMLTSLSNGEIFVADFNNDGKPDVMVTSSITPNGFKFYINQGEKNGKIIFTEMPAGVGVDNPNIYSSQHQKRDTPDMNSGRTENNPVSLSPVPETINTGLPKLKTVALNAPTLKTPNISKTSPMLKTGTGYLDSSAKTNEYYTPPRKKDPSPAQTRTYEAPVISTSTQRRGSTRIALYNYRDKTNGTQLQWLESAISNILKFDVVEVESAKIVDRNKTDVLFNIQDYQSGTDKADIIITGEFSTNGGRLSISTQFLDSTGESIIKDFIIEGDPTDIYSVIQKVGIRVKQEISSL